MVCRPLVVIALAAVAAGPALAHDLERTQVSIAFARDGAFVLDVANDPAWLLLQLEPFSGRAAPGTTDPHVRDGRLAELAPIFIDRVVLFVDGHEVRPTSAEYLAPEVESAFRPPLAAFRPPLAAFRLRGRVPFAARTLRWFYGLVIDPYPLRVRFADGRSTTHIVAGDAWSEGLDLSGRFERPMRAEAIGLAAVCVCLLIGRANRLRQGYGGPP